MEELLRGTLINDAGEIQQVVWICQNTHL